MPTIFRIAVLACIAALLSACERPPEPPPAPEQPAQPAVEEPAAAEPLPEPTTADDRSDAMTLTEQALQQFTAGNRDFALSLYAALAEQPGQSGENLLVSPHSILSALAMVYAGAEGETREQMRATLRLNLDEPALHQAFAELDRQLAERAAAPREGEARGFELNVVNRLWGQQDYAFVPDYLALVERYYGAGVERVDFERDPDGVRQQINAWVEDQTRDRIRDLLPENSLNEDTSLVLVNAIYFLASWQEAFEEASTRPAAFHLLDGSSQDVPMMQRTGRLPAHVGDDSIAVAIPYLGSQVSLLALMPTDETADFATWERSLDRQALDETIAALAPQQVALDFPKFRVEGGFRLGELLQAMGMPQAFDPPNANFERMTGVPPGVIGRSLYIDEVFHKTFIDLDEAGTEAAAATAVVMMRLTALVEEPEPIEIRFDRPFVYAIYDQPTGSLLFLGRLLKP